MFSSGGLKVGAIVECEGINRLSVIAICEDDSITIANLAKRPIIPKSVDKVGTPKGLDRIEIAVILEPDKVHGVLHVGNVPDHEKRVKSG
jgi:hypothetical protein